MSSRGSFRVLLMIMSTTLFALAGCADPSGAGLADGKRETKPSRDVGDQVDAVMKDFKNE